MKRGHDGILRTVGGIEVKEPEIVKTRKTFQVPQDETIHTLYIVNSKYPPSPIQEAKCRIVVTEKVSWAEPIMPLRGKLRTPEALHAGSLGFLHEVSSREEEGPTPDPGFQGWTEAADARK